MQKSCLHHSYITTVLIKLVFCYPQGLMQKCKVKCVNVIKFRIQIGTMIIIRKLSGDHLLKSLSDLAMNRIHWWIKLWFQLIWFWVNLLYEKIMHIILVPRNIDYLQKMIECLDNPPLIEEIGELAVQQIWKISTIIIMYI